jgi:hypothetical protein
MMSRDPLPIPVVDKRLKVMRMRLSHPGLGVRVDVALSEHEGRWLAVATVASEPDVGTGYQPREALRAALEALGEPYATEMAGSADLPA